MDVFLAIKIVGDPCAGSSFRKASLQLDFSMLLTSTSLSEGIPAQLTKWLLVPVVSQSYSSVTAFCTAGNAF
jgi:hypothetical protein